MLMELVYPIPVVVMLSLTLVGTVRFMEPARVGVYIGLLTMTVSSWLLMGFVLLLDEYFGS
jgi:hypothetical protein